MRVRAAASLLALLAPFGFSFSATAATLPPILTTSSNKVPVCVTPGRMMAFLSSRNSNLDSRYDKITVAYMRHGEELGVRWDYGFFQMLVETASLRYTGDVRAKQNNFAGLGATGGGVRGESFKDVSSGVRAHLEHVLMYTGTHVENPVAERTRKVQAWGVLDKWRSRLGGPMTYKNLTSKWSPGDRGYPRDIAALAKLFFDTHCNGPDPQPALLAEARSGQDSDTNSPTVAITKTKTVTAAPAADGASASGATAPSGGKKRNVAVLNAPKKDQVVPFSDSAASDKAGASPDSSSSTSTSQKGKTAAASNCRVWTASYGGARALIIKAVAKGVTNYTVLDVNEGREKREAGAYISAYAKGGSIAGEYPSPETALKQAFQLCPEG